MASGYRPGRRIAVIGRRVSILVLVKYGLGPHGVAHGILRSDGSTVSILVLVKYGLGLPLGYGRALPASFSLNSCSGEVWPRAPRSRSRRNRRNRRLNSCSGEVWPRAPSSLHGVPSCVSSQFLFW